MKAAPAPSSLTADNGYAQRRRRALIVRLTRRRLAGKLRRVVLWHREHGLDMTAAMILLGAGAFELREHLDPRHMPTSWRN